MIKGKELYEKMEYKLENVMENLKGDEGGERREISNRRKERYNEKLGKKRKNFKREKIKE